MAKSGTAALTVAVMAAIWTVAMAQSSQCTNVLISLSPCLNYITGNSTTPSPGCCSQLGSVVRSQPKCLCEAITGNAGASLGLNINRTVALGLPGACGVQTPPLSRCNGAASPSRSPTSDSTTPSSTDSGNSTTPSESNGSKTVPSVDASKGHATKAGLALFVALFLFAGPAWDRLPATI